MKQLLDLIYDLIFYGPGSSSGLVKTKLLRDHVIMQASHLITLSEVKFPEKRQTANEFGWSNTTQQAARTVAFR